MSKSVLITQSKKIKFSTSVINKLNKKNIKLVFFPILKLSYLYFKIPLLNFYLLQKPDLIVVNSQHAFLYLQKFSLVKLTSNLATISKKYNNKTIKNINFKLFYTSKLAIADSLALKLNSLNFKNCLFLTGTSPLGSNLQAKHNLKLIKILNKNCLKVNYLHCYKSKINFKTKNLLANQAKIEWIVLSSPAACYGLTKLLKPTDLHSKKLAAIGTTTANALKKYGLKAKITSKNFDVKSIILAILNKN